jgi:hypothetical protein
MVISQSIISHFYHRTGTNQIQLGSGLKSLNLVQRSQYSAETIHPSLSHLDMACISSWAATHVMVGFECSSLQGKRNKAVLLPLTESMVGAMASSSGAVCMHAPLPFQPPTQ